MELLVLAYHKIGSPTKGFVPTRYYVSENTFREHIQIIAEAGWDCVSLLEFGQIVANASSTSAGKVLITLDDAYSDSCDGAGRLLQSYNYPFVIFAPTAYVGGLNQWDIDIEPTEHICTWAQLERLQRMGASIESHSRSHRNFSSISDAELLDELCGSRLDIQRMLGVPPKSFAYPYGDPGSSLANTARLLTRSGYERAFTFGGPTVRCATKDAFCLSRLAMYEDTCLSRILASET
jgi:peptidoglycan/xylan/chitin deacetylase (PgdA/CDA1 family)